MGGSYVGSGGVPARRGVPVSVPPRARARSLSRSLCLELDDGPREGPGVESILFFFLSARRFVVCIPCSGDVRAGVAVLMTVGMPSRLDLGRFNG